MRYKIQQGYNHNIKGGGLEVGYGAWSFDLSGMTVFIVFGVQSRRGQGEIPLRQLDALSAKYPFITYGVQEPHGSLSLSDLPPNLINLHPAVTILHEAVNTLHRCTHTPVWIEQMEKYRQGENARLTVLSGWRMNREQRPSHLRISRWKYHYQSWVNK